MIELISRMQKGCVLLIPPPFCCFHLAPCSSPCIQVPECTKAFQSVVKGSFALENFKDYFTQMVTCINQRDLKVLIGLQMSSILNC